MKLEQAFKQLYNLLALDKTLRDEMLKELVQDKSICFLLSIGTHYTLPKLKATRGGQTVNYEHQLLSALNDHKAHWGTLGLREQIVLIEILSTNFNPTIFYGEGVKVYSKIEINKYLSSVGGVATELMYLFIDKPKTYFVIKHKRIVKTTIPKGFPPYTKPQNYQSVLLDVQGNTLATGNKTFGDYLLCKGRLGQIEGNFSKATSIVEIQYRLNKLSREAHALVFHPDGIMFLHKESIKVDYDILDLVVSEDFEPVGVWIRHGDRNYKILCPIPQTLVDSGVSKYTVTIKCNELLNGSLNNIEFVKLNVKGE